MTTQLNAPTPGLNIEETMDSARTAYFAFLSYTQDEIDVIVEAVYRAGFDARIRLAEMACEETRLGVARDKVLKNIIATRYVYQDIKDQKTVGVISENTDAGIVEIAQPIGPIFAVTPVTNPTSTVLFKILIALKTRNPIIIRPHGAAKKCSIEAARICYEAAVNAGAPKNCVQWIRRSSEEETLSLMSHRHTALILATGSVSLVRSAYCSGNPAIGIGPGNVPVYIGRTADFEDAVRQIMWSKTFDNGTICASEQAVVVKTEYAEQVRELFRRAGGHYLSREETAAVSAIAFNMTQRVMNPAVIGRPVDKIAQMAGIHVPEGTRVLLAELSEVGLQAPLSLEILAPVLAFYVAPDFDAAIDICRRINRYGGLGHTACIYSNDEERIEYFSNAMNAGRILVNTPASIGALGGALNSLSPSMTLACGSGGKNITTDNITAKHLINIQRVARRRSDGCLGIFMQKAMSPEFDSRTVDENCRTGTAARADGENH